MCKDGETVWSYTRSTFNSSQGATKNDILAREVVIIDAKQKLKQREYSFIVMGLQALLRMPIVASATSLVTTRGVSKQR